MRDKTPRQVLANVRRLTSKPRRRIPNWALAMEVYAVGSSYGHWICRENGIDPDAYTLTAFEPPRLGTAFPGNETFDDEPGRA